MIVDTFAQVLSSSSDFAEKYRGPVAAAANRLLERKVDTMLLLCDDSEKFAAGMLAGLYAGVEVILPPNMRPDTLSNLKAIVGAVFADGDLYMDEVAELPDTDVRAGKITFHTSGSLGASKPIQKSVIDLQNEAQALHRMFADRIKSSPVFGMVPHQHMFGMTFRIVWPLLSRRQIIGKTFGHWEDLFSLLEPGATIVAGPAFLARMGGLVQLDLSLRPKMIISGGAPLSVEAADLAADILGTAVSEFFGSTETGVIGTRSRETGEPPWTPLPGLDIKLENDQLVVGETRLADKVLMLPDGRFEFLGRSDRIVKIEAARVNLSAVEESLVGLESVKDAAILVLEKKIAAVVTLTEEGRKELALAGKFRFERRLRKELASTLENTSLPRRWRFVNQIPSDQMNKRPQKLLAQIFDDEMPDILSVRHIENDVKLSLFISGSLKWFEGHFPDTPVLPGVVQLDWAVQLAAQYFDVEGMVPRNFKVKYRDVIVPDSAVDLSLKFDPQKQRLSFQFESAAGVHSSGSWPVVAT
jgi:3-hydroxymyristoyl/3-hydroxydecanoyl-(acyl carrier protein) dehydratase